jgi:uncharacterized protein YjiS (DUF1127 family)
MSGVPCPTQADISRRNVNKMSSTNQTYLATGSRQTAQPVHTWLSSRIHNLRAYLAQRRARAEELRELYRCTDRELWDIGLSRSDFMAIENGTYRRD